MNSGEEIAKVLWYYNVPLPQSGNKIICPFHGDKNPSMVVDYEKGACYCFGCQKWYSPFDFVREMEREENGQTDLQLYLKYLRILKSEKCSNINFKVARPKKRGDVKQLYDVAYDYYHGLPRVDWAESDVPEVGEMRHYMRKRGFAPETLTAAGARVTYRNPYMLIFPMLDNGIFRGWVSRTSDPIVAKTRKYLYNKGFSRIDTLVGNYKDCSYVFVVEGYMDYLKFVQFGYPNCVAILGWKITQPQIKKLHDAGITRVVSAVDNDSCGRDGSDYLSRNFDTIRFFFESGIKDVGEMDHMTFCYAMNFVKKEIKEKWEY